MSVNTSVLYLPTSEEERLTILLLADNAILTLPDKVLDKISNVLGFSGTDDFIVQTFGNREIKITFGILAALYYCRSKAPQLFDLFWKELVIKDKQVEKSFKELININESEDVLPVDELFEMWNMESSKDEWDDVK